MSREAALDLRQVVRECYNAVAVKGLQRSRRFRRPTNCAFPDHHNTLVHWQSELAAVLMRPPRSSFLMHVLAGTRGSGQPIYLMSQPILMSAEPGDGPNLGLWAALPVVTNAAETPA